jgi:uncharacterized protein
MIYFESRGGAILFEWDDRKNVLNRFKHGVRFELATFVFHDPLLISVPDHRYYYREERWQSIGTVDGILIYVAHTIEENEDDKEIIRIISARAATPNEERRYYTQCRDEAGTKSIKKTRG